MSEVEGLRVIQLLADVTLIAFVSAAAVSDFTRGRIPNRLTVGGLAAALLLRVPFGPESLLGGLQGLGLAFALSLVPYALRAIGGGDVKLLAGIGAFLGVSAVPGSFAVIAILGGVLALVIAVRRGVLPLLLFNTLNLMKSWRSLGRSGQIPTSEFPGELKVPYGIPIAVGTLISWFGWGIRL
jgi:prepilin peptidase CpaA